MITIKKATDKNLEDLMTLRLELNKELHGLPEDYTFGKGFLQDTEQFFLSGNQTTYLAYDGAAVGCATICYYDVMPGFRHPSGKQAVIMNVYTRKAYRRQGLASTLLYMLVDEAKEKGVTKIVLDASEEVKSLYYKNGFTQAATAMEMDINHMLQLNIRRAERTNCQPPSCHNCSE